MKIDKTTKIINDDNEIIEKLLNFLGYDGISFFIMCLDEYNDICPVWSEYEIPHPVHFREGMMIRNFLRSLDETKDWNGHDFDNNYQSYILSAIALCLGEDN